MTDIQIVVLAAGNGSRMQSDLPKVMHLVGKVPMLEAVLDNSSKVTDDIVFVYSDQLKKYLVPYENIGRFVLQKEPKGTAHATYSAIDFINKNKIVVVLYGDHPLITPNIIYELVDYLNSINSAVVTLSFQREDPAQYGRIMTDQEGNFLEIIEFKNATEEEKKIKLCNSGIMVFSPGILNKYLPMCLAKDYGNQEIYLTSIVKICKDYGEKVSYFLSSDYDLIVGVNTQEELLVANNIFLKRSNCP